MHTFYLPDVQNGVYCLSEEESRHCIKILRLKRGEKIQLIDGKGTLYIAELISENSKQCNFKIINSLENYNCRCNYLHIAIAPTKNIDRFEWFIEKATEIGIDEITPLLCEHSERKIIKSERLTKVLISAMKQAVVTKMPVLNPLTEFDKIIQMQHKNPIQKYIAYCGEIKNINLNEALEIKNKKFLVLIGPEGDFSEKEVKFAMQHQFQTISLGFNRLRTETAGIYVCSAIAMKK